METSTNTISTARNGLTSKWVMAAGVVGLVAAGALGNALVSQRMNSHAAVANESLSAATPAASAAKSPADGKTAMATKTPVAPKAEGVTHTAKPAAATPSGRATPAPQPVQTAAVACANCGVVESVRAEKIQGQSTGVGAVAGGLIGGIVGNQFGGGTGRSVLTVAGAVGGGMLGNEVEKNQRATTVYMTQVRMEDGTIRTFKQSAPMAQGQRVKVDGQQLVVIQS